MNSVCASLHADTLSLACAIHCPTEHLSTAMSIWQDKQAMSLQQTIPWPLKECSDFAVTCGLCYRPALGLWQFCTQSGHNGLSLLNSSLSSHGSLHPSTPRLNQCNLNNPPRIGKEFQLHQSLWKAITDAMEICPCSAYTSRFSNVHRE